MKFENLVSGLYPYLNNGTINLINKLQLAGTSDENNNLDLSKFSNMLDNEVSSDIFDSISFYNDAVIKALDIDGDGKISTEEKEKFKEFIKGYDGDISNCSESDILRAFYDIYNEEFSYDIDLDERALEFDEMVNGNTEDISANNASKCNTALRNNLSSCSSSSYTSAKSYVSGNSSLNNMSLAELEQEKSTKESEVQNSRNRINEIYSGENEAVKAAEEDCKEAENAYNEAVENDERINNELKAKRQENIEAISNQETQIDTVKTNINNKEGEISSQESAISAGETKLSGLKSQLSALSSQSSDDPEQQAAIDARKREVEAAIQEAEQTLNNDKQKLEQLKGQLGELKEQLSNEESTLQTLQSEKTQIESEINNNGSNETRAAMRTYNQAKAHVTNVKNSELNAAKKDLSTAQENLNNVNTKINEKELIVADDEWQLVSENNIDLSEKLANGEPRYILAQGTNDNKYHVYDMAQKQTLAKVEQGNNRMYDLEKTDGCSGSKVAYMDDCGNICEYNACYRTASPLSFDINGDGVKTSDRIIEYDIDGDGETDKINDSADAVLVFDKNGDGISGEDGSECFGNNTDLDGDGEKDGFNDGFEALKTFAQQNNLIDGIDDNVLDENDIKYLEENFGFKIKLYGYNSEAVSLSEAGITEINLSLTDETYMDEDFDGLGNNLMTQEGATFTVNGETKEYADIWHKKK